MVIIQISTLSCMCLCMYIDTYICTHHTFLPLQSQRFSHIHFAYCILHSIFIDETELHRGQKNERDKSLINSNLKERFLHSQFLIIETLFLKTRMQIKTKGIKEQRAGE